MELLMGSDQEALQGLFLGKSPLLEPKAVAAEAGISLGGLYNLWNQPGRVVPTRVWRACMRVAQRRHADNLPALTLVASIIGDEVGFTNGVNVFITRLEGQVNAGQLCGWTAEMLGSVANLVGHIGQILADGQVNAQDRETVQKYHVESRVLMSVLVNLGAVLSIQADQAVQEAPR